MAKKLKEIRNVKITHVSLVNKGANGHDFLIIKSDTEPTFTREIPIIKVDNDKCLVTGIVYAPDEIDSQGEFMTSEEIEKAAHSFMKEYRNIDKNHTFKNENADVVESYIAKSDHTIGDKEIKKGTWVMTTHVGDKDTWQEIQKGKIKGYSMGGTGQRVEHDEPQDKVNKSQEIPESQSEDEMKGFFNVLKGFFIGKEDTKEAKKSTATFAQRIAIAEVTDGLWRINDTLSTTLREVMRDDTVKDKRKAMEQAIDEYAAYMKSKISAVGNNAVAKSVERFFFDVPVEKEGKKISAKRMETIKNAVSALQAMVNEADDAKDEEEIDVNKEEMQQIMKAAVGEALKPINERLDKLEKTDQSTEEPKTEADQLKETMKSAVLEAVQPLEERLSKVEKARNVSKQMQEEPEQQKVTKSIFGGVQI